MLPETIIETIDQLKRGEKIRLSLGQAVDVLMWLNEIREDEPLQLSIKWNFPIGRVTIEKL